MLQAPQRACDGDAHSISCLCGVCSQVAIGPHGCPQSEAFPMFDSSPVAERPAAGADLTVTTDAFSDARPRMDENDLLARINGGLEPPMFVHETINRDARALPVAVQLVCRDAGRHLFVEAIRGHPSGAGGVPAAVFTSEDAISPSHAVLAMPDGHLLDAEGLRTFVELCRDLGLDPSSARLRPSADVTVADASTSLLCDRIRQIADLSGWTGGAPRARDSESASRNQRSVVQALLRTNCSPDDVAGVVGHVLGRLTSASDAAAEKAATRRSM